MDNNNASIVDSTFVFGDNKPIDTDFFGFGEPVVNAGGHGAAIVKFTIVPRPAGDMAASMDSRINEEYTKQTTWGDFTDIILQAGHTPVDNKNAQPFFMGCHFLRAVNANSLTDINFKRGDKITGTPITRRCRENVDSYYIMAIDSDAGMTYAELMARFGKYEHIGYTSYNHMGAENKEKYRLLVLLKKPISGEEYFSRKASIKEWLGAGIDTASANTSQGFYLAGVSPDRVDTAKMWHNKGIVFDIGALAVAQKPVFTTPTRELTANEATNQTEWLIKEISTTRLCGNNEYWGVITCAAENAVPESTAYDIFANNPYHTHSDGTPITTAEIQTLYGRAKNTPTHGFAAFWKALGEGAFKRWVAHSTATKTNNFMVFVGNNTKPQEQEIEPACGFEYNQEFCKPYPTHMGTLLIKERKGAGKTHQAVEYVKKMRAQGKTVLVIAHRVLLLQELAKKFDIHFYQAGDKGQINKESLAICINSLSRIQEYMADNTYDVVILDEIEQTLESLTTIPEPGSKGTWKTGEQRKAASRMFIKTIENAKHVVCMDADLSELTTKTILGLRKNDVDINNVHAQINTFTPHGITVNMWLNHNAIVKRIVNDTSDNKSIFIASNNKKFCDTLEALLLKSGTTLPIYNINANTKDIAANKQFMRSICGHNQKLLGDNVLVPPHILITSPSIGTGYDIQCEYDGVFGIFDAARTTHWDMDQHMCRVRSAKTLNVHIGVAAAGDKHTLASAEKWFADLALSNESAIYNLVGKMELENRAKHEQWFKFLEQTAILVKAKTDGARKYPFVNYVALKENQGCLVNILDGSATPPPKIDKNEDARAELIQNLLDAPVLDKADIADNTGTHGHLRYNIERFFGESILDNIDIIDWYLDRRGLLYNFHRATLPPEKIAALAIHAEQFSSLDNKYIAPKSELLERFRNVINVDISRDNNNIKTWEWVGTEVNIGAIATFYSTYQRELIQFFKFKGHTNIEKHYNKALKALLLKNGLILSSGQRKRVGGKQIRYYTIDAPMYEWAKKHAILCENR